MSEEKELRFRGAINTITKSEKSLIILMDGKAGSLKKKMVDKLIDRIEPSRYELMKYDKKDFNMCNFWVHGAHKHKIMVWDGSYKQDLEYCDKEELKEVQFFEQQMERYGFKIVSFRFTDAKDTYTIYNADKGQLKICGKDENEVFETLISNLTDVINQILHEPEIKFEPKESIGPKIKLDNIENEYKYEETTWKDLQKKYQKKIRELHEKMIDKGKSLLIVFQGIDGAGKSSTIRRLTEKMCPHWYNVYGFGAPTKEELDHHYLWRFATKLPEPGEIVIFDRSYYERLTAERVLKLNGNGWVNGVDEIKEFERELEKNGIHVVKFFYTIDKDTQGERFKERENNPLKTWKVSEADYKTREMWDEYVPVFEEMLGAFNSDKDAIPFNIVKSVNKREARVNCLKMVVNEMKKILKKK